MDRKKLEQEYMESVTRYDEAHKKYVELLKRNVPPAWAEPYKRIESTKHVLNPSISKEIKEARQKLDEARQKMDEIEDQLYKAYH